MLIINRTDVERLLPMAACIEAMADAMRAASRGSVAMPLRLFAPLADGSGSLGLMPGSVLEPPFFGAKVISLRFDNPAQGLPTVQGYVSLFDHDTGTPVALIEGSSITALRTAAASGLATRALARQDARTHGVFGTGVQAVTHIDAVACVRDIDRVVVWGRDAEKTRRFAAQQAARTQLEVTATQDPAEAARCDVVSTVTAATRPILKGEWLEPGCHLNLVGVHTPDAREADTEAVRRSRVYVDRMESAMNEAGDLLIPIAAGAIGEAHVLGEIGAVLAGAVPGRTAASDITLYKSLGIVAQDLFAAARVYARALENGAGFEVDLG
ncbi:MAG TPA: ornithine cyclodeaminase family protein [Woeseiaceae bacterium]|nr:ornithine cyclodeaminase family protein [Woeseiaceae bacterium]